MRTSTRRAAGMLLLLASTSACSIFEDPTPDHIAVRVTGDAGTQVRAIYSKEFIAGVNEAGVTQVQVFRSDTVDGVLPVDTVIGIAAEHRLFVQVAPFQAEKASVTTVVEIDGRRVVDDTGDIFTTDPWQYVYLFNQQVTRIVDVIF